MIDDANPWLGLASFTEDAQAYFFGREEEVAELARRVQRKLLTVLFGQSGLGKTSILRAGLVPRLRAQGYCPVYVRIDYGADAPEAEEQVKEEIRRSARQAGEWSKAGVAQSGETLWEFLHHRDDVLRGPSGTTLIPLLIFDQFEEVFTLAQSDDRGRARAAAFLEALADLVENRPPKALEARLEADEKAAEAFDFMRGDYRVLIALREDYLAPLEGLRKSMPSVSQNRLRLAPMNGRQALEAVLRPGKSLATREVAEAIVRFVAGGAELGHAEVEPALLSLVCRELNDQRVALGRGEITLDLLAGAHGAILATFYERCLADQPPQVRRIIEDDLLTASGFRESVAEERLQQRLKEAGVAADVLSLLVTRRLLRVEERLDVRRVELTHDVLCGVVKESRQQRREEEARAAAERRIAEERERERAARRALHRARAVAATCIVLALGALAAAGFAVVSSQRARQAEEAAERTRAVSEQARAGADQLLGYLSDEFVRELETFGRNNVVAEFSRRQTDYFRSLPAELRGVETTRSGALAMVHYAKALRLLGSPIEADQSAAQAIELLEGLRRNGDASEATTVALARAYTAHAQILDNRNDDAGPVAGAKAAELLQPLAQAQGASEDVRRAYVEALVRIGWERGVSGQPEAEIKAVALAQQLCAQMGAREPADHPEVAAMFAESGAWYVDALRATARDEDARREGIESLTIADKVLEARPGFRLALHAKQVLENDLVDVALDNLDPEEAIRFGRRAEATALGQLRMDPRNIVSINNLGAGRESLARSYWAAARPAEANRVALLALDDFSKASVGGTGFGLIRAFSAASAVVRLARSGNLADAAEALEASRPYAQRIREGQGQNFSKAVLADALLAIAQAAIDLQRGDATAAARRSREAGASLESAQTVGDFEASEKNGALALTGFIAGPAEYRLGNHAAAEQALRRAIRASIAAGGTSVGDRRDLGVLRTWLAMALARQGKTAEAASTIAQVVEFQHGLAARNRSDRWQPLELAQALYAQSLADGARAPALLREVAALFDTAPAALRDLREVREWRGRIEQAQPAKEPTGASAAPAAGS